MFVPVACLKCGKLFQVPEAAAGTEVACPWCKAATPALPVAGAPVPPPVADAPGSPAPTSEPLSLDDAEPAPPPAVSPPPPSAPPPTPKPPVRVSYRSLLVGLVVVTVGAAVTLAVLRYGSGYIPPSAWAEFTPPDGSCTVLLPGTPVMEPVEPASDTATRGGERYVTTGWYSGVRAWVGWQELDPAWVKSVQADKGGVFIGPVLNAEVDRRKQQAGGSVTRTGSVKIDKHTGQVVEMDTPRGKLVEWSVVVADGPRPRLYFLGVEGKGVTLDGPAARKLFDSFRVR